MNYTFKKSHSRILTLVMVLLLLVSMLAGCKKDDETSNQDTDPAPGLNLVDSEPTETQTEPTETEPINQNMAVITTQVNVRSSPSTTALVLGTLDEGTEVEIIQEQTALGITWWRISDGWIPKDSAKWKYDRPDEPTDPSETTDPTTPEETTPEENNNTTNIKGVVTAGDLIIRKEASTGSDRVGSYSKGDVITILETKNGWGRTDKGWVSMTYVNTSGDDNNDNDTDNTTTTTGTGTKGIVIASELNIRDEAGTAGDRVGIYTYGDRVTILETKNGWGRTDKGWVSMDYIYKDGTTGTNTAKGIVTGNQVNIRSGPGIGYDRVASVSYGDRVNILEQIKYGNTTWACTKNGWISMDYIYVDGTTGEGSGTGTVTGDQVNIRTGPGTGYDSVGSKNEGDTVEILAQFKIGDMTWGCTSKGWISMTYVDMD